MKESEEEMEEDDEMGDLKPKYGKFQCWCNGTRYLVVSYMCKHRHETNKETRATDYVSPEHAATQR